MIGSTESIYEKPAQRFRIWSLDREPELFAEKLAGYRKGTVSEEEFRRFRLQHGIYSERFQKDFVLARIKVPSGILKSEQLLRLADLAESFSIGSAHITTRQNIQLHWITMDDVPELLRRLHEVGLTTREACGNTVRNVTSCYMAGVCRDEAFDVSPYALATAKYLLRNPLNQNLPRKFKINFSGCAKDCSLACIGDIGAIAEERVVDGRKERGFKIYLGGGLGPASYVGQLLEDFTPEADLLVTCLAVIRIFDRFGDREKMHRNRMRYLVHDLGFEKFKQLVLKERVVVRATLPADAKLELGEHETVGSDGEARPQVEGSEDPDFRRLAGSNLVPQKQNGYYAVHVTVPGGDISADQLRGIADICTRYSREGGIRNTQGQNLVILWVPAADIYNVYARLVNLGLASPGALSIASAVGCTGATSCNLAITNSHRLAREIQRMLLDLRLDEDPGLRGATVKVSGCPNSCGQHALATIGFFGASLKIGGRLAPAYVMLVGGKAWPQPTIGHILTRVPAKKVIPAVAAVIELYRKDRHDGEHIDAWIDRVLGGRGGPTIRGEEDLKREVEAAAAIRGPDEEPEAYTDWGSETAFVAKTARGECAA